MDRVIINVEGPHPRGKWMTSPDRADWERSLRPLSGWPAGKRERRMGPHIIELTGAVVTATDQTEHDSNAAGDPPRVVPILESPSHRGRPAETSLNGRPPRARLPPTGLLT
jgi:hypothetical protein